MALIPVADGWLAAVVTTLEQCAPPALDNPADRALVLEEWPAPEPDRYRALFCRVGARWLWYSRLAMDDARLRAIIHDPAVTMLLARDAAGAEIGFVELDFRQDQACEIAYFALVPELTGRGLGRPLMRAALTRAWRPGIARVWLHTCTLDHPAALDFYRRQGFVAVKRTVETFPDPRLSGLLPPDAAPQIPCLGAARRR